MNQSSRTQGGLICVGVAIAGLSFVLGLLQESYWALAIPVAILVFFVLGLSFWVGYTIATIRVEPFEDAQAPPAPAASSEGQAADESGDATS